MPVTTGKKPKKPRPVGYGYCRMCQKDLQLDKFYQATNPMIDKNGYMSVCKDHCNEIFDNYYKIYNNIETAIQYTCRDLDVAYNQEALKQAQSHAEKLLTTGKSADKYFGYYKSKLGSTGKQNDSIDAFRYKDSDSGSNNTTISPVTNKKNNSNTFIVTDEIIDKWGSGYTPDEYMNFEKKWNKLIDNYGEKTSFHTEGLTTYIRFRVKEEMATARGDVGEAKSWAGLAKEAATAAKINVLQLSKSDISGGIELVPQIFEAVESEVGIIPTLPKLKEQPYDDADLIIWCIVNYQRRLDDKSRIEYKDIWGFYDEMLQEHFAQQGYSLEQIEKEKKKRNNVFRDLGKVYIEPVYEEEREEKEGKKEGE